MPELRRVALAAALVVLAAGCGGPGGGSDGPGDDGGPSTSVTIEVVADEGAQAVVMTLECDPPGGDHPNVEAACEALAAADADVFEPVPQDQPCTLMYGGPQRATAVGTLDGEEVDASFSREDGCETARWDALGTEVFDVPLQ